MILLPIEFAHFAMFQIAADGIQYALHRPIQHRFIQPPLAHGLHNLLVICAAAGGHFQLQSGF